MHTSKKMEQLALFLIGLWLKSTYFTKQKQSVRTYVIEIAWLSLSPGLSLATFTSWVP